MFSLVLDTFCICKSMALQTQNTRIDASGIMNFKMLTRNNQYQKKTLETIQPYLVSSNDFKKEKC